MKQTKKKKIILLCLIIIVLQSVISCGRNISENITDEIVIDQALINLSGYSEAEFAEYLKMEGGPYQDLRQEGDRITICVTDEQKQDWTDLYKQTIADECKQFALLDEGLEDGYRIDVSEDYKSACFYYNLNLNWENAIQNIQQMIYMLAIYQLFSSNEIEQWDVNISIYNCDTNLLVASGNIRDGWTFDDDDWKNSYPDATDFLYFGPGVPEYFGMEEKVFYQYIYEKYQSFAEIISDYSDTQRYLLMVVSPSQKDALLETIKQDANDWKNTLESQSSGYKLEWSNSFESADLYYDNKISNEDINNITLNFLITTMLYQVIEKGCVAENDIWVWKIQLNIYNATSLALNRSLNIPTDGITIPGQNSW